MPRLRGHVLVTLTVLAVFAYGLVETQGLSPRARLFPLAATLPALVLATVQLARGFRRPPGADPPPPEAAVTPHALLWFAGFFAGMWLVGLLAALPIFSVVYLRFASREPWRRAALYAALAWASAYFLFVTVLHVPFPEGMIAFGRE